jgi:hypothetical protein
VADAALAKTPEVLVEIYKAENKVLPQVQEFGPQRREKCSHPRRAGSLRFPKSAGFIIATIDAQPNCKLPVISRAAPHLNTGMPRLPMLL